MSSPLLYESHMHTPLCKHAVGDPSEYAAYAEKCGLKGIIITCHNPIPGGYSSNVRMDMAQFDSYVDLVAETRKKWKGRVDVRLGLECDFFPGAEPWLGTSCQRRISSYLGFDPSNGRRIQRTIL